MMQSCAVLGVAPLALFRERFDADGLKAADLIDIPVKDHDLKIRRLKTSMFYKQQKFNLLREESEGYV